VNPKLRLVRFEVAKGLGGVPEQDRSIAGQRQRLRNVKDHRQAVFRVGRGVNVFLGAREGVGAGVRETVSKENMRSNSTIVDDVRTAKPMWSQP